jgi:plastocyanin
MLAPAVFLATAGLASAATIPVAVGRTGLTFDPNVIHAKQGDVIEFRFWPRNHSVVAGDFKEACRPAANTPFWSGFFPTQPNTINVCSSSTQLS